MPNSIARIMSLLVVLMCSGTAAVAVHRASRSESFATAGIPQPAINVPATAIRAKPPAMSRPPVSTCAGKRQNRSVRNTGAVRQTCVTRYSALIAIIGCTAAARRADGMPARTATRNAAAAAIE